MESIFSNKNILHIFSKWWKHIVIITVIGTIVVGASTFLVKRKYKSFADVYPLNLGAFSEETYTEQMIQILNSKDIAREVVKELKLDDHWGIPKDYVKYKAKVFDYYYDFVSIRKTPFESVEISALDVDPSLARDIVNSILKHYNEKVTFLHREKILEYIELNEKQIASIEEKIKTYEALLGEIIKKSGNKDFAKVVELGKGESKLVTKIEGDSDNDVNELKKIRQNVNLSFQTINPDLDIDIVKGYGTEFLHYFKIYREKTTALADLKVETEQLKIEAEKKVAYYAMISSPYVADKKHSPKRIPITLIGGMSVLLVCFIIISIIERNPTHS
ncbi:MAG: Wzz/FepE/Etk N-terminal domain-containing protein [Salinivirgaceae bacterium]|jgi:capsule polysaccharide export protein KpsE/RkpR|nr:hypothetical protein [Bacteroidales bacterium]